jgi:hypothetical protein
MGRARDIANVLSSSTNIALDSEMGLSLITPTSIAVTGGSGSISSSGKISLTSATSVKVNGCFSSSYDNYKIIIAGTNTSTSTAGCSFKFVKNTVEASSNYFRNFIYSSNSGGPTRDYAASQSLWAAGAIGDYSSSVVYEIIEPFVSTTRTNYYGSYNAVASSNNEMGIVNGFHVTPDSYDGFSWSSGTFTGSLSIYGYRK